ncbi:TPA: LPXTG cell wall anchor domain-containing protein [Streptococcus suis]
MRSKDKKFLDKHIQYAIRKTCLGVGSVAISMFLTGVCLPTQEVGAEEVEISNLTLENENKLVTAEETGQAMSSVEPVEEERLIVESTSHLANQPLSAVTSGERAGNEEMLENSQPLLDKEDLNVTSNLALEEAEVRPSEDLPNIFEKFTASESQVRPFKPQNIKVDLDKLLDWQPETDIYSEIAKSAVPLAERVKGQATNPLANPDAKVQSLAYLSSSSAGNSSVGGGDQGLGVYAFDNWQYLDSMVFWDGLVPNPDVIDAAHRNGVSIYGTIFHNWSASESDRQVVRYVLQEDAPQSRTFPVARKLVDIANYYGFDGYFINQETNMSRGKQWSDSYIDFMHYAKSYAKEIGLQTFDFAWYDAMSSTGGRYHGNAVDERNKVFMQGDSEGDVAVNDFFVNFNWDKNHIDTTVETLNKIGRSPFDAYAGLELQKGGSYNTYYSKKALVDEEGKARVSLGLFVPDTIMGIAKDGVDFHKHEQIFWTGPNGDPTTSDDTTFWSGISRYVVEKTPIVGENFHTNFNTGHGKYWFVDGVKNKNLPWNSRSVQQIMPTWRWWIRSEKASVEGNYDFEDAYHSGTSLKFTGQMQENSRSDIMLYAMDLDVTANSLLNVVSKGHPGMTAEIGLATSKDYAEENTVYFGLQPGEDWTKSSISLSSLATKKIYGLKLRLSSEQSIEDMAFNLGSLSIGNSTLVLAAPSDVRIEASNLANAQEGEVIISYKGVEGADYYEIYQDIDGEWEIVNATSSTVAYLPTLRRSARAEGSSQRLKVVAVAKNGTRSTGHITNFDWKLQVDDTTFPTPPAENIVLGAKITYSSAGSNSEGPQNLLSGTINNTADKWYSDRYQDHVDIELTQPRRVARWIVDHAGAGGEAVQDGSMNTHTFDLQYKDMETGEWKLAHQVVGNKDHVTDIILREPIRALEWRLNVTKRDNGTPWGGIRIYNWKMYETVVNETENLSMNRGLVEHISDGLYAASFKDVPAQTTIYLYSDKEGNHELAQGQADQSGHLVFKQLGLKGSKGMLYYRAKAAGKELSNILALPFEASNRKIVATNLALGKDFQFRYHLGEALNLTDGFIEVTSFVDGQSRVEKVPLSNGLVELTAFETDTAGLKEVGVRFNGQDTGQVLRFSVIAEDTTIPDRTLVNIGVKKLARSTYLRGQELELDKSSLELVYDNGQIEEKQFDDTVSVFGYDAMKFGPQTLTISYKGLRTQAVVSVEELNYQMLDQGEATLQSMKGEPNFALLSDEEQKGLVEFLAEIAAFKLRDDSVQDDIGLLTQLTNDAISTYRQLLDKVVVVKEDSSSVTSQADSPKELVSGPQEPVAPSVVENMDKPTTSKVDKEELKEELEETVVHSSQVEESLVEQPGAPLTISEHLPSPNPAFELQEVNTGVRVLFEEGENKQIVSLRVRHIETNHIHTPQVLSDEDYDLFDIQLLDQDGNPVQNVKEALVLLPIDEGKEVLRVSYLPNSTQEEKLDFTETIAFDENGRAYKAVAFVAKHFSEYLVVYRSISAVGTGLTSSPNPEFPIEELLQTQAKKMDGLLVLDKEGDQILNKNSSVTSLAFQDMGEVLEPVIFEHTEVPVAEGTLLTTNKVEERSSLTTSKQLPNTGSEVSSGMICIGLVGLLGAGILRKKEK